MAYQHKPNTGNAFTNQKRPDKQDADWKGTMKVACPHCAVEYDVWLSVWQNQGQKGPYLGVGINPMKEQAPAKEQAPQAAPAPQQQAPAAQEQYRQDEIPF